MFSVVKVKLLFKNVFISVLIIPGVIFVIGKYIFKLSPSVNVNKNGKIYFLIQRELGQDVHKKKEKKNHNHYAYMTINKLFNLIFHIQWLVA